MAYENYDYIMGFAEDMIDYVLTSIEKECKKELKKLNIKSKRIKTPFKRITHNEAIKIAMRYGVNTEDGNDISWDAEKVISEELKEPLWIIDYPIKSRAWYYRQDLDNPEIVKTMDLLYPEGYREGVTGGEREYDYETLIRRINEKNESPDMYKWYLDMFKYGMPPSAGFGLGIERLVRWILNLKYIWETNMFPRVPGIISP